MPEAPSGAGVAVDGKLARVEQVVRACGCFDPGFFGEVVVKIRGGGVASVDVKQTFKM